jgi:hypothetical protein
LKDEESILRKEIMADPSVYSYPSPLEGYEGLPALPEEKAEDGKSKSALNFTSFTISDRIQSCIINISL